MKIQKFFAKLVNAYKDKTECYTNESSWDILPNITSSIQSQSTWNQWKKNTINFWNQQFKFIIFIDRFNLLAKTWIEKFLKSF